jgi:hypothetical protein
VDLAQILGQLWKRRVLVGVSALLAIVVGASLAYHVSVSPIGLEKKSLELGTASTTLLLDSRSSSVIDLAGDLTPLSSRARSYAAVASSDPVIGALARDVHVPRSAIISDTSLDGQQNAAQREKSISQEQNVYRVAYIAVEAQPLLQVTTQAPSTAAAVKLANGSARALNQYVTARQDEQKVPDVRRVAVRQLGSAKGATINSNANIATAALGGAATFVALVLLILFSDRLRSDMRRRRGRGYNGQAAVSPLTQVRHQGDFTELDADAVDDRRRSRPGA